MTGGGISAADWERRVLAEPGAEERVRGLEAEMRAQVRREGYQQALNDMLQRLDRLMENSEDMDWHRGVLAARHELCHLLLPPASPEEAEE